MLTLLERARKTRLLMMDVDGVLTDGRIIQDGHGHELKVFDVKMPWNRHGAPRQAANSAY
jgi:3-deoxy-D-manno-octulosonate 8-phosphate phosphatase (KDO 8-P phosphatase)